jgi:hypothetical protein
VKQPHWDSAVKGIPKAQSKAAREFGYEQEL